ncbi:MAG: hypothetical protein E7407_04660 [Ruminococcaceae bacterium]|nr:hypothetical protein [Oscillospiraceae bacterium]
MKIPNPFLPVRVETDDLFHKVNVVGREYTFGPDGMLCSIVSDGVELLAEPMRIVITEDGEAGVFDDDYHNNESESFIQSRSDEQAVICGCKQTKRFVLDFCNTVDYDGNIDIDFKVMTRGFTVAQVFGVGDVKPLKYQLDKLWLEIPLKKEICSLCHMYPNSDIVFDDGTVKELSLTSASGAIPEKDFLMPFKSLFWMGNEDIGLGWFSESNRNWQPKDEKNVIEVIHREDKIIIRIRLLDSHPACWTDVLEKGPYRFRPLDFHFGFHATPVKPFPKNPYIHNAFHLDCGKKIKGNYGEFLSQDNHFDKLKKMGVTTLILHEKWNKSQNWFELSEFTSKQLKFIVDECHKRGIKVLPYFGYEISTMSPLWSELNNRVLAKDDQKKHKGGWWRVPFQRAYISCYNSEYADYFIEGITNIVDTYNLDGVYLDGTAYPWDCCNTEHGCGWYDENGNLHPSYPLKAIRKIFKRLHSVIKARGGQINVHLSGVLNFTAFPYIDQIWSGESLQSSYMKGSTEDVNLDYFRAEYIGRNMGVPVEFIAYENRPVWNFENALSCSILHGILPRPNDIDYPLEFMSGIWKIFDTFPIEKSEWMPYYKNEVKTSNDKVKVSYYKYTYITGEEQLLAFIVNISANKISSVTVDFKEKFNKITDLTNNCDCGLTFALNGYDYKILFMR